MPQVIPLIPGVGECFKMFSGFKKAILINLIIYVYIYIYSWKCTISKTKDE